jgi:DNA-binding MarR family transcriptional regulator
MTRWLSDQEMAVWEPFVTATMNVFAILDDELKQRFDITHLDYGILTRLSADPQRRRRMSHLAVVFGVDPSVITYRIGRLEQQGVVRREMSPEDGRGVFAILTDEGQQLLDEAAPIHVESVRRLFMDFIELDEMPAIAGAFARIRNAQQQPSL